MLPCDSSFMKSWLTQLMTATATKNSRSLRLWSRCVILLLKHSASRHSSVSNAALLLLHTLRLGPGTRLTDKRTIVFATSAGEQKMNMILASMPASSCRVTIQDLDGVSHTVEITAASLYDAVAQGLAAIRGNEWVAGIAQGINVVRVSVADVRVEHEVKLVEGKADRSCDESLSCCFSDSCTFILEVGKKWRMDTFPRFRSLGTGAMRVGLRQHPARLRLRLHGHAGR